MEASSVTFKQAQTLFPNEWVLVGNPVMRGAVVEDGVVLFHSKDKKEVCYLGRNQSAGFERIAVAFTGQLAPDRKIGILRRL
ncbi:hypothetical protein [Aliterella atlantica]|uniref:Uncharacterized protein n=1 Tax=Aliterella atlantica CENA595 TaxID=1618023 RepID=A0A0D8ZKI2_9CYAN|nr:hypothetical protein [Aliterella atlantica]KJH69348.1 hypothetical protein UH38_24405 [Aliterella atlantica CENA595]